MWDLLEFVLNLVLEALWDWGDLETYWRFGLPMIVAFLLVSLIEWRVPDSGSQTALSIPVLLAGLPPELFGRYGRSEVSDSLNFVRCHWPVRC